MLDFDAKQLGLFSLIIIGSVSIFLSPIRGPAEPLALSLRYGKSAAEIQLLKKEEETPKEKEKVVPWDEPANLDTLLDYYIVEGKFSGRSPGTSLFLVRAQRRDGSLSQITEGQEYKLFLATWLKKMGRCVELSWG